MGFGGSRVEVKPEISVPTSGPTKGSDLEGKSTYFREIDRLVKYF